MEKHKKKYINKKSALLSRDLKSTSNNFFLIKKNFLNKFYKKTIIFCFKHRKETNALHAIEHTKNIISIKAFQEKSLISSESKRK